MTLLADIIEPTPNTQTDAAIVVERSLYNQQLITRFAPTQAAIKVLKHVCKAVLPHATQQQRAINLFGHYGSGKSHLAVLIAQLLRDGSGGEIFSGLLQRISNFGEPKLAQDLKNTFLISGDPDAKPYLLVSLYGSETPSLAAKLMEGLFDSLERHPQLNHQTVLPKTEYEVCVKRFDEIVNKTPALANADLPRHLATEYATTKELRVYLVQHKPEALITFKKWHKEVCHGALFNPGSEGGKNFIEAYVEAGKNLAEQHNFGGIVVVWDEFGYALEDLIRNSHQRDTAGEIMELQRFIETVCAPSSGHTLFIALSHISFPEYADRMSTSKDVESRLEAIDGRFSRPFKIELSVSESEGYHLLGMQRSWTVRGKELLVNAEVTKQQLFDNCRQLSLFNKLGVQLTEVLNEVYPLHPITAAGLFALSEHAQANRTALTFFRDNATQFLQREVGNEGLFQQELIRLPELVDYYQDKIREKKSTEYERYNRAIGKIPVDLPPEQRHAKQAILKLCLLTELLGENFQTTEKFLAITLYDAAYSESLINDLAWLKAADLLWKNDLTQQWTLSGDTGVDIEALISKELTHFAGRPPEKLFIEHHDMLEDLLPQVGEHDLEPSTCGIVRSYRVSLLTPPLTSQFKLDNPLLSGQVFLVLANNPEDVELVKNRIQETTVASIYFWLPLTGIRAESVTIEGKEFKLGGLLCRYLALENLLKQKTNSEELHRQLMAKWERTRQEALTLLRLLYGRDGLQLNKSKIFKAGITDALTCVSWHDVRNHLAKEVQDAYPHEVPIRANNMNKLNDEKYTGSKKVLDMIERILKFESNTDYQNDLLGENGTSEQSALIDGVVGANNLFIQRPNGWDIKQLNETDGNIHKVLKHIHVTLLRKRESPYMVKKLRDELIAPPYGIPACNLALFSAVAIRNEVKKLRWVGCKEVEFAKNLNEAFEQDSKLTIRLVELSAKEFAMLDVIGQYFQLSKSKEQTPEEFADVCNHTLRKFVKGQLEAVKSSKQLQDNTRELVRFFDSVGKSSQDLAVFLIGLFGLDRISAPDIGKKCSDSLKELLIDFAKVEDANRYDIEQSWKDFVTKIENKSDLMIRLNDERATLHAKAVASLLSNEMVDADQITRALLDKSFDQCDDRDIGKCQYALETLVDYHPPSLILPPPVHPITPHVIDEPIRIYGNLIDELYKLIIAKELSDSEIKSVLSELSQLLLTDYQDA